MRSTSQFAWMKWVSTDRFNVPLTPTTQCSLVRCTMDVSPYITVCCLTRPWSSCSARRFVLTQQISSTRRKPHRFSSSLACSRCVSPHHRKQKDCVSAISPTLSCRISSKFQASRSSCGTYMPATRVWYSSQGGSTSTTSNLVPNDDRSNVLRSHFRDMLGVARLARISPFSLISRSIFGYSEYRFAYTRSRMKFCGRCPVSMKVWQ
mmetsp:Transcript_17192/g.45426  ORF Transcript_17192/g.45426 Transcript_17192/m.45426 type:complete len:207 (-) Transcript_17192:294-914(-)